MWHSTMDPAGAAATVLRTSSGVKVAPPSPLTEKVTRETFMAVTICAATSSE